MCDKVSGGGRVVVTRMVALKGELLVDVMVVLYPYRSCKQTMNIMITTGVRMLVLLSLYRQTTRHI